MNRYQSLPPSKTVAKPLKVRDPSVMWMERPQPHNTLFSATFGRDDYSGMVKS